MTSEAVTMWVPPFSYGGCTHPTRKGAGPFATISQISEERFPPICQGVGSYPMPGFQAVLFSG